MFPLISILTTVFNREKYLAECIESVLALNYQNWELILVDDCSKDNSASIIKEFARKDDRIHFFQNEKNLGDYPNRNKAASYANGKYLKYLDADDTIYKYSLDYMVDAMEKFPEAALGLSFNTIDDKAPFPQVSEPSETIHAEFLGKSIIGCGPSASIIKNDVFKEIGGFSGKPYVGDHELWFKIGLHYPIVKLQPSLVWWRVHNEQQIVNERKNLDIRNIRFQNQLEHLEICKNQLSSEEFKYAIDRIKQNYARNLLRLLLTQRQILGFIRLFKLSKLSWVYLIKGFKGYK